MQIDRISSPRVHRVVELERRLGHQRRATLDELLSTIINRDEVDEFIKKTVDRTHVSRPERVVLCVE